MKTSFTESHLLDALAWIVRLPLLGDAELAQLLATQAIDARHLREELARRGWIDWIEPGVAELAGERHAAFLRTEALADLAAWSGFGTEAIARRAPACDGDVLYRVPRIGIVSGVNWLLANLAAELRERGEVLLTDACSLPVAAGHWGPRGVDAYAAVGGGRGTAPFFVAWDRTGAPDSCRRQRVADWATASDASTDAPPTFVVCADRQAQRVWEEATERCQERGASIAALRFATAAEVLTAGPRTASWSIAGSSGRMRFEEALSWRSEDTGPLLAFGRSTPLPHRACARPRFRAWARDAAALASDAPVRERSAALAAATSAGDKLCLDWLARHPRLSGPELAVHLDLPAAVVDRRLALLLRLHAVRELEIDGVTLWCVTPRTLRLLASAEDAPWRRKKRPEGPFSAPSPEDDLKTHPSIAHQLGINHVFTRFAVDARRAGWRLGAWRNEAESKYEFPFEGRRASIRPDGTGTLICEGRQRSFLLEYDRGTLDGGDFAGKFQACRHYYATEGWRTAFDAAPLLLFVCSDDRAERRVIAAAQHAAVSLPLAVTAEWRFLLDRTNGAGLFGPIWRGVDDREERVPLMSLWDRHARSQSMHRKRRAGVPEMTRDLPEVADRPLSSALERDDRLGVSPCVNT